VRNLIAGIECPTRVIYADPPQPYLPEPLRSEHVALLPRGERVIVPGTHHLHMEQPAVVAAAIGDFLIRVDPEFDSSLDPAIGTSQSTTSGP
jgi:pimeloyl-ACP methyl ester carboxylesterase